MFVGKRKPDSSVNDYKVEADAELRELECTCFALVSFPTTKDSYAVIDPNVKEIPPAGKVEPKACMSIAIS